MWLPHFRVELFFDALLSFLLPLMAVGQEHPVELTEFIPESDVSEHLRGEAERARVEFARQFEITVHHPFARLIEDFEFLLPVFNIPFQEIEEARLTQIGLGKPRWHDQPVILVVSVDLDHVVESGE